MTTPHFIPLPQRALRTDEETLQRATTFAQMMEERRTVRNYSHQPVARAVIEECLRAARTSPSGANLQPWHFVAVADRAIKSEIRAAAEEEEREFYEHRAPAEWLEALRPLGTDSRKEFLEVAPWLIAIFAKPYGLLPNGARMKHYYATESVGIATGILVTALHQSGLVTLTHTPSPMAFLNRILGRPAHEKPFLLLVIGHPAADAGVPDITRKALEEVSSFFE